MICNFRNWISNFMQWLVIFQLREGWQLPSTKPGTVCRKANCKFTSDSMYMKWVPEFAVNHHIIRWFFIRLVYILDIQVYIQNLIFRIVKRHMCSVQTQAVLIDTYWLLSCQPFFGTLGCLHVIMFYLFLLHISLSVGILNSDIGAINVSAWLIIV